MKFPHMEEFPYFLKKISHQHPLEGFCGAGSRDHTAKGAVREPDGASSGTLLPSP